MLKLTRQTSDNSSYEPIIKSSQLNQNNIQFFQKLNNFPNEPVAIKFEIDKLDKFDNKLQDNFITDENTLDFSIHEDDSNKNLKQNLFNSNKQQKAKGSHTQRSLQQKKPPLIQNKHNSINNTSLNSRQRFQINQQQSHSQNRSTSGNKSQTLQSQKQQQTSHNKTKSVLVENKDNQKHKFIYNFDSNINNNNYQQQQQQQHTYRPQINPISKLLASQNSQFNQSRISSSRQSFDLHSSLYIKGQLLTEEKEKKVKDLQKQRDIQIKNECTFQPNQHKYKFLRDKSLYKKQLMQEHLQSLEQFYDKNLQWEEEKQQRLLQERERQRYYEMSECIFQPNIREKQSKSPYASRNNDNFNKQLTSKNNAQQQQEHSILNDKSVQQFLQRINKARQLETRKETIKNSYDGSMWKGDLTKPKPFKITPGQQAFLQSNAIQREKLNANKMGIQQKPKKKNQKSNQQYQKQLDVNTFRDAISMLHQELYALDLNDNLF